MATQTQTVPDEATHKPIHVRTNPQVSSSMAPKGIPCPDPSVHDTKNAALQEQASTAALYVTNLPRGTNVRENYPSDADNKISSAGAAASLKYARAQDLPSFPVVGVNTQASAGAAATLANANKKSVEQWKSDSSEAAGKAAFLAKDYKTAPLWSPEASAAGSKAALLAHRDAGRLNLWIPEASADGNSAANIAMRKKGLSPGVDYGYTQDGKKRALMAATGAVSGRRRAESSPIPVDLPSYPDSANSAQNALSAATIAHRPSVNVQKDSPRLGSGAVEAARIQHSRNIPRAMYTEHPPVALEVEEQNRQSALRASAISMAKQMYEVQQRHIDEAAGRSSRSQGQSAATTAHGRQPSTADSSIKQQAMQYINLQEAAQKLATERLVKIGTDQEAAFRSYYGYEKQSRSRLSMRHGRRRAASDPELVDSDDKKQSRRIRSQMSQFSTQLAEIDVKKRQQDRRNLLAAAERKVQAQMHGMDEKVFNETGKMSPAMIEEWDAKARAKAAADSEARMANHGKVHVGGGKFLDQSEIDAVAAARIQPTLNEINDAAEKQRARDEEVRFDQEEQKRQAQIEKQRAAELKTEEKRVKAEEKASSRTEKEAERAKRAEEKRILKDNRKSKDTPKPITVEPPVATSPTLPVADTGPDLSTSVAAAGATTAADNDDDEIYRDPEPVTRAPALTIREPEARDRIPSEPTEPTSPTKSGSKGFKHLFNKLKRRSKHSNSVSEQSNQEPGFIGGAALTGASSGSTGAGPNPSTSNPPQQTNTASTAVNSNSNPYHSPSVSSLSGEEDDRGRAVQRRAIGVSAVSKESDLEEARDTFDERLAPPPNFGSDATEGRRGSPVRDSRFLEQL